ncbi:hypothetical protein, conserved [Trypanosoma brucei brucei TREU927]|uniref:Uncharacterized protein n=4 Tax=Trypanozoon TaxID=39700 RepID=Q580Y0_TRYB2|nr:hypothetical protein, conserved [Trypanosoma brucei brucei TREU927]AAX78973.1 hypothetical protein, conserved [Trypanosoma brucei]AAZ13125.1 hypothetical protein, conserved [Trypanosoma brucei brucei TREU927]
MAMRRHLETTDFSGYTRVLARRRSVIPLQLVKKMGESKSDTTGGRGNGRRLRKATLTCMRCRLSMLDWPYCGMTGEPHRMEEVAPICG